MRIGSRIIKTCICIWITSMTSVVIMLIAKQFDSDITWLDVNNSFYNPFFAGLATANALLQDKKRSINQAKIRGFASIIGGLYAMAIVFIFSYTIDKWIPASNVPDVAWYKKGILDFPWYSYAIKYTIASILAIFLIKFVVWIKKPDMVFIAILTYLAVVVSGQTAIYGIVRIISTIWGVLVSLAVNLAFLPRFKNKDKLFIVCLDGFTNEEGNNIPSFELLKINKLIEQDANVVFYSTRTAGAFSNLLSHVEVKNPVILYNGAGIYDYKKKNYLFENNMDNKVAEYVMKLLDSKSINYFENVINDDLLYVFNKKVKNEAEIAYSRIRKNAPYTAYVVGENNLHDQTTYIVAIDKKDVIENVKRELNNGIYFHKLCIHTYDDPEHEGYAYLKIYDKSVYDLEALEILKKMTNTNKIISIGCGGTNDEVFAKSDVSYICDNEYLDSYNKKINISYHRKIEEKFIKFTKEYYKK
ncbi:MAG: HAD hydrolase family protein [Anaeroplasmataceae bacterium]